MAGRVGSGRNPAIQMVLPMEEEVKYLVGERSQPFPERSANRWGSESDCCAVMEQKVPVVRPRVQSTKWVKPGLPMERPPG